jgi:hypothetical protein
VIGFFIATAYLLYSSQSGLFATWSRGLIYAGIIIAVVYGATFLLRIRINKTRDIVFVLFSIAIAVVMMVPSVQAVMQNTISLELVPFGLLDRQTGQIVLAAYWIAIPLIAGLLLGVYAIVGYIQKRHLGELS